MPRFAVIYGDKEQPKETWMQYTTPERVNEWDTPQHATEIVRERNAHMREHKNRTIFMIKRLPDVVDYRARELANGIELFEYQGDTYHMATHKDGMVSYYQTLPAAYDDRRTEMKLGRYLKGYLKHLTDNEISEISAKLGVLCGDSVVQFARTREEIREVYENGPRSCMSGSARSFNSDHVHPSEAYATDDIAVAFIKRDDDRITARAVCNMKDKKWVTIYGDSVRMDQLLLNLGFTHEYNALLDCRFLKIPVRDASYAMCYQDGDITLAHLDDKYLIGSQNKGAYSSEYGYVTIQATEANHQTCGNDDEDYDDGGGYDDY